MLFIQRPPNIYPSLNILEVDKSHGWALPAVSKSHLRAEIGQSSPYGSNYARFASLSSLVLLSWHIIPRGFGVLSEQSLWSPGLVEVALNQWHQSLPSDKNMSCMPLYLLVNISIHANLSLIQKFAYSTLNQSSRNVSSSKIFDYLHDWTRREECEVAIWHAANLLERAAATFLEHDQPTNVEPLKPFDDNSCGTGFPEPPQLVYGVYFACLVIWSYTSVGGTDTHTLISLFGSGKAVLRVLKVRISRVLLGILAKLPLEHPG